MLEDRKEVGVCGLCGGRVVELEDHTCKCTSCGAYAQRAALPVLEMTRDPNKKILLG